MKKQETQLILAPHLGQNGVLEVDTLWQNSDYLALLCHPNPIAGGNMMNKVISTMYRFTRDKKMNVVRFNYRGVGRSSGNMEYGESEFIDTLHVLSWAIKQTNAKKLWLGGFSFGGYIACQLTNKLLTNNDINISLDKLILIAPSIEKNNTEGLILNKNNTKLIYGNNDELVNPKSLEKFAKKFEIKDTIIIPEAGHFFHGKLSILYESLN